MNNPGVHSGPRRCPGYNITAGKRERTKDSRVPFAFVGNATLPRLSSAPSFPALAFGGNKFSFIRRKKKSRTVCPRGVYIASSVSERNRLPPGGARRSDEPGGRERVRHKGRPVPAEPARICVTLLYYPPHPKTSRGYEAANKIAARELNIKKRTKCCENSTW